MNVLNVTVGLDTRRSGGYAERTFQMTRYLHKREITSDVLTLALDLEQGRIDDLAPGKVTALPLMNKRLNFPMFGWFKTFEAVKSADIVHLMGHWYFINVMAYLAVRYYKKPYVVCPAGALPLFGRSKLLKRSFNYFIGNAIVKNADKCIAVVDEEFAHFEDYGVPSSSVVVIPNGVDRADFQANNDVEFRQKYHLSDAPIILFVGRLNTIKGPDILLDAYIKGQEALQDFQLVFIGPDEGLLGALRQTVNEEMLYEKVHFLGHVGGADKAMAYYCAELLVIPSRQEAMSIVAIEAGICGTPVLLTDQCGFSEIKEINPLMEVPVNANDIARSMQALLDEDVLEEIKPRWKAFVNNTYSWDSVIEHYVKLYTEILSTK